MYSLGATVIIVGRSLEKILLTIQEIKSTHLNSKGKLEVGILDTSDLDSVKKFVDTFLSSHSELHYLVNNAGIHYVSTSGDPIHNLDLVMKSKQGYDLAFATNYLGIWMDEI